MSKRNVTS